MIDKELVAATSASIALTILCEADIVVANSHLSAQDYPAPSAQRTSDIPMRDSKSFNLANNRIDIVKNRHWYDQEAGTRTTIHTSHLTANQMEDVAAFEKDHLVWKVVAKEPTSETCTFDARILFHDWSDHPPYLGKGDAVTPVRSQSYFDHPVPFELILPNRPFTLVVRKNRDAAIAPSLETRDKTGRVGSGAWGHGSTVMYVHLPTGLAVTSLPDNAEDANH